MTAAKSITDGTILELGAPSLPTYEDWLAEFEPFVAQEYARSGLSDELRRRPLRSIFDHEQYLRLERAVDDGRCLQLVYASGGLRVRGYLITPLNPKPAPVIVYARGGNRHFGSIGPGALLDFLAAAESGYLVVGTQYRGGPGSEGSDQFGGDDLEDLRNLARLARALEVADAGNLFLWGASRGGMMAALALHAGLDVRAVALRAPMLDLHQTAATRPDMRAVFEELMPDYIGDPDKALARRSALCWPHELRAPILLLHGRQDMRVPVTQSERLAEALQAQGVETELVLYERESHLLLLRRAECVNAITDWFSRHIDRGFASNAPPDT